MINILFFYLTLQLFALVGLPLAFAWLRHLPSRGYAAAKALGLLLTGVLFWWGGILHLWSNTAGATLTAAGLLFTVGLWAMRHRWEEIGPWWQERRTFVLLTEGLFLVAFVVWASVRAGQPQIVTAGGEKWMEITFLNGILRAPAMPPHDPWLSGFAISYYYLGYLLLGLLTRVSNVAPTVAFTLGNAAWFALAACVAYGIVHDLLDGRRPTGALLAPFLLLVVGNGEGLLEILHARGLLPGAFWRWLDIRGINTAPEPPFRWLKPENFDWWQASRTLHDYAPHSTPQNPVSQEVIDEFPAFSFILGDMHPHLLALPFVLLAVVLALNLWQRRKRLPRPRLTLRAWRPWVARFVPWLPYAAVLGALGFLNTWDFPIYWSLVVAVLLLLRWTALDRRGRNAFYEALLQTLPDAVALGLFSVLLYLPFWVGLRSQAGGILPNVFNATHPAQFAVMFLPFLIPITAIVLSAARNAGVRWSAIAAWSVGVVVLLTLLVLLLGLIVGAPYIEALRRGEPLFGTQVQFEAVRASFFRRLLSPWTALLLTLGVVALILAFLRSEGELPSRELTFPALLALLGLGLTLVPEFFFLQDVFSTRMNTIFKFYFQAWVLWSLAGAWWLIRESEVLAAGRPVWRTALYTLAFLPLAAGLLYTLYAVPARAAQNRALYGDGGSLDGAAWLAERHPEDWQAITWLNANVAGRPVILETPGDQHRAYIYEGRVSAFTGLPTVLGWAGHERQWRGTYEEQARREADIEALFLSPDPEVTRTLLDRYDVRYIYVGPVERSRYPQESLAKFAALFPVAYANEGVTIYRVDDLR
jgi:YYY domain-containing protein